MVDTLQKCPNCQKVHDVSVYVTGQQVRCACGLPFKVERREARPSAPSVVRPTSRETEPTVVRPSMEPSPAGTGQNPTAVVPPQPKPAPSPTVPAPPPPRPAANPTTTPDRGQVAATQATTAVVKRIEVPGYELIEMLGKGGMGEVWRARQLSLGRTVAIKVLAPELASDVEFVQRFEKEAAALAALSHPNIVQIIDRGANALTRTFYFTMELCEGQSLRELITRKALSLPQALKLITQIGHAIAYAHGRGVIHRDLKPENILVDAALNAKVVDFGLAGMRRQETNLALTRAATAMGTLHYMAPEQRRDARSVDERADVYSLGIILYEVLTGEIPMGRFKLPSERVPGLDSRLDKIVSKALEPEPEARYSTAHDMTLEVELVLGGPSTLPAGPAEVATATPGAIAARPDAPPLRARVAGYMVAFALIGVVGLALWTVLGPGSGRPTGPEVPRVESMPPDTNGEVRILLGPRQAVTENEFFASFAFQPGEEVFRAGTGEWKLVDAVLQARVFGRASAARPLAVYDGPSLVAGGLRIVATVAVDPTPPAGYALADVPRAELALQGGDGARLAAAIRLKPSPGFSLTYRKPGGETIEEVSALGGSLKVLPVPGQPITVAFGQKQGRLNVLQLEVKQGEEWIGVLNKEIDLAGFEGRLAIGCVEATCQVSKLELFGRRATVAGP